MKQGLFTINDRFVVDPAKGEVIDKTSGQKSPIEPRLIRLLCLLAAHHGSVLARQQIAHDIWDNYPGASDGINQAISFLRKLLSDDQKEIIKTIPKEGYVFTGVLSQPRDRSPIQRRSSPKSLILSAGVLFLLLFGGYFLESNRETKGIHSGQLDPKKAKELFLLDSKSKDLTKKNRAVLGRLDEKGDEKKPPVNGF